MDKLVKSATLVAIDGRPVKWEKKRKLSDLDTYGPM